MQKGFIEGETVRLSAPRLEDFTEWSSWMNDSEVTKFLPQGFYPYSESQQMQWVQEEVSSGRILLMVREKISDELLGVVSLSTIDLLSRTAQVATVVPKKHKDARFAALEARALIMEHAFMMLGLRRLTSAQVFPGHLRWTTSQLLIGWIPEYFSFNSFKKGSFETDVIHLFSSIEVFAALSLDRSDRLWPGAKKIEHLLEKLKQTPIEQLLLDFREAQIASIEKVSKSLPFMNLGPVVGDREPDGITF